VQDSDFPVKPWLKELPPYVPGKSLEEVRRELGLTGPVLKLASNENPLGPSPKALEAIKSCLSQIHRYPEADANELISALADYYGVASENIVLGNGSNEILDLLVRALVAPGEEILISEPSFLMYQRFGRVAGAEIKKIPLKNWKHDLESLARKVTSKTRMIFLDLPHNPTGSTLTQEEFESFLSSLPKRVLVVIDEAYGEFVRDPSAVSGIQTFKRGFPVAVVRTFSKAYGLAGLRIGYGILPKSPIKAPTKSKKTITPKSVTGDKIIDLRFFVANLKASDIS